MDALAGLRELVEERGICGMASVWYVLLAQELGLELSQCRCLPDGRELPAGVMAKLESAKELLAGGCDDTWEKHLREYCRLFTEAQPGLPSMRAEAGRRLRVWFREHPGRGWDDVLGAVCLYLANTESRYVSRPHYFVRKKADGMWVSLLDSWLEKLDAQRRLEEGFSGCLIE